MGEEKYPTMKLLREKMPERKAIVRFMEWLAEEKGFTLAKEHKHDENCKSQPDGIYRCGWRGEELMPCLIPLHQLINAFQEIDEIVLDDERRACIDSLQADTSDA